MRYDGKRWIDDIEGLSARKSAKLLSDALVRYAVNVDADGKYLKAVTPLCNLRNRDAMLKDSRDIHYFTNEQLDTNDYLLNLQNGTLDLSKNTPRFRKHDPDLLLSKFAMSSMIQQQCVTNGKSFYLKSCREIVTKFVTSRR